jgi:2-oxoglutarate ferredoxin oxidoreductase subunit delta
MMNQERTAASVREGAAEPQQGKGRRPRRRGRVITFDNWCKGCGLCIAFCPQKVFEPGPEGHPIVAHEECCTACNWCYYHCPDFAIRIEIASDDDSTEPVTDEAQP